MFKSTVAIKSGKIVRLKTIKLKPDKPIILLKPNNFLYLIGTSFIICFPKILTLKHATEKLIKDLIKQKSRKLTPIYVVTDLAKA